MNFIMLIMAMAWMMKQPDNAASSAEAAAESATAAANSAASVTPSTSDDLAYIIG